MRVLTTPASGRGSSLRGVAWQAAFRAPEGRFITVDHMWMTASRWARSGLAEDRAWAAFRVGPVIVATRVVLLPIGETSGAKGGRSWGYGHTGSEHEGPRSIPKAVGLVISVAQVAPYGAWIETSRPPVRPGKTRGRC